MRVSLYHRVLWKFSRRTRDNAVITLGAIWIASVILTACSLLEATK